MLKVRHLVGICCAVLMLSSASFASAEDKHAGYYYPKPKTVETYQTRIETLPEASRKSRIAFIVGITNQSMQRPYPPRFAIFAKGDDAEKLIVIGLDGQVLTTLYRIRAALAQMTAMARVTPVFQEIDKELGLTFLDMLFMMGFNQITLSDGDKVAHQILLQ